jgi:hypothetical protein
MKVATLSADPRTASFARVQLNTAALGLGDFAVEMNGTMTIASFVNSYRRDDDGETFIFRIGNDALSVMTTFYGRPALGHIVVDGHTYFISPEGDHHVIAPANILDLRTEKLRYPNLVVPAQELLASVTPASSRRRACCASRAYRFSLVGVLSTSYLAALGDEQTARDRMAHMIDYTNAALRSSAYYQGSYYLRETVVRDLGEMEELRASD